MSLPREMVLEALKTARDQAKGAKFAQSVELIIALKGVDPKKADERVQLSVGLPHGIEKKRRICVFALGDLASRAKKAGVDRIVEKDELDQIVTDKKAARKLAKGYDFFISEGSLMATIARHMGRFLGPRDKMPIVVSPSDHIDKVVESLKRTVRLRTRDQPVIQCVVGSESMSDSEIFDNIQFVVSKVIDNLKKKMSNIGAIYVKMTMGKPIKISF